MKVELDNPHNFEDPANGKLKYLRPFIVLLPTFVLCCYDIYTHQDMLYMMLRILICIFIFYIVGSLAQDGVRRLMIQATLDKNNNNDADILEDDEDEDEESEGAEEQ